MIPCVMQSALSKRHEHMAIVYLLKLFHNNVFVFHGISLIQLSGRVLVNPYSWKSS